MKLSFWTGGLFIFVFAFSADLSAADDPFESSYKGIEAQLKEKDDKKICKQIKAAAGRFPIAMMMASKVAASGMFGADRDQDDAFSYLEKAAKKGFRPAIPMVARAYYTGNSGSKGKQSEKKAFDYCSGADLLHCYAVLLESSDSDDRKSTLKKLRSHKDANNSVVLAYCQLRGMIVTQDPAAAVSTLEGVLKRSPTHGETLFALSQCCRNGVGMDRDVKRADELLVKALDAGNPQALFFVLASGTPYYVSSSSFSFRRGRGSDDSDEDDGVLEQNFSTGPQIYEFQAGRLDRTYMRADQVDRPLVKLLTEKHIGFARKLADAGDIAMVALMYEVYKYGLGVKADDAIAESWFNKRKYYYLMGSLSRYSYSSRYSRSGRKMEPAGYEEFQDRRASIVGNSKRRIAETSIAEDNSDPTASSAVRRHVAARRTIVEGEDVGDSEWNALR